MAGVMVPVSEPTGLREDQAARGQAPEPRGGGWEEKLARAFPDSGSRRPPTGWGEGGGIWRLGVRGGAGRREGCLRLQSLYSGGAELQG